jgi:hypothetical protein
MAENMPMKCDVCGTELHGTPITASLPYTEASSGTSCLQVFRFCLKHGPEIPADQAQQMRYLVGLLIKKNPSISAMIEKE